MYFLNVKFAKCVWLLQHHRQEAVGGSTGRRDVVHGAEAAGDRAAAEGRSSASRPSGRQGGGGGGRGGRALEERTGGGIRVRSVQVRLGPADDGSSELNIMFQAKQDQKAAKRVIVGVLRR